MNSKVTPLEVYFYVPNIVGYLRIILCAISYYYALSWPEISVLCYFLGQGMDAVDGVAARYFNQCSRFGQLLDMLTDRMGTLVLYIVLSQMYQSYWGFFAFLIVLDIVSHWCQMFVTMMQGKNSHKGSTNRLLDFYYNDKPFLFMMCAGNEFFGMGIYYLYFNLQPIIYWVTLLCFPIFAFKQVLNVVQLFHNIHILVEIDAKNAEEAKIKALSEKST